MPHRTVRPQALSAAALLAAAVAPGCAHREMPDPQLAARRYAEAVERGDSDAVYQMLTSDAQRAQGKAGVKRLIGESRTELERTARAVASDRSKVETLATVRFADGEQAELSVEAGRFRVQSAGALPHGARTPAQALAELRQALARRSYAGILRVLSSESRSALENDLRSLVDGLDQAETLDVKVTGDRAQVQVPGGHSVKLKREAGIWRIEDFD